MTIYDIAAKAGVSASTVSRVINGRSGIGKATRERVEAILKETGFVIDEGARSLVSQKSHMVGILVSDIRNQHHIEGAYMILRRLQEEGYVCLLLNAGESPDEKAECIRILARRKIDALVLVGSAFECPEVEAAIVAHMSSIPVVFQNGSFTLANVHSALAAEDRGTEEAVDHLYEEGRRRIAYVNNADTASNRRKIAGYRRAMARHGLEPLIVPSCREDSGEAGGEATASLLANHPDVDAIIFSIDITAVGACRYILDSGRRIPDDIAVIGTDDSPYARLANPRLTSIDTKLQKLSDICCDMLLGALEGREEDKGKAYVEASLTVRETG
ncbi:MAG: LacI family DNA-binding transcriptional regulator [Spirochaetes bacterium]|uniref:LacI family DNA-binding transcriptional regulator n=1 Tax=Candidatus Aphodenecus pullistercoris TaxID=2840669 RepID=A0A9D9E8Z3_9SPIR|nr:LacI family DNA-binding transcriptional regulator [Candidatus Aphodenecus pullistercoris]